jgi:hypothetical protein
MYWPSARECRHYLHAARYQEVCGNIVTGWTKKDYSAEGAVREVECDVSYLEDAPGEELEHQSERIRNIAERLNKLKEKLRQE